jgi:hypothetical protein
MKKIIFLFCGLLMFGLSSCIKPGENTQDIKAYGIFDNDIFIRIIRTSSIGPIYAAELQSVTDLEIGDAVFVSFRINFDQQTSNDYWVVSDLQYEKLNLERAIPTTGGESTTGDFDLPIETLRIFDNVGYYFFFGFNHKGIGEGDKFLYEMTYNGEKTEDTPELIIRARKSSEGSKYSECAFNLSYFLWDNRGSDNTVKFSIKYKAGVDNDGKDDYRYCTTNDGSVAIFSFTFDQM